jgi:DNA-binding MarR family transcriptional regulator
MSRRDPTEFIDTFGTVRRRISALAAQAYATADLGPMQAKLLRHLGKHAPISQAELARITDSDPALAGRVLGALIERGLIQRERSKADRREYVLELTAAGRRMRDRIEKLRSELAAQIVGALDPRDLDDFERIACKILAL